jgi:cyclopropane-fatty-acyl-phospholipid synthase
VTHRFGRRTEDGAEVVVRLSDRRLHWKLLLDLDLFLGEAYMDGPSFTGPWLRKYIFPGAYIPALSELLPSIEQAGLWVTDLEILRLHYAETLRHWRQRFLANAGAVARTHDARFCRMWEYYLALSEVGFRHDGLMVFQVQLAKRVDTVPLTRDYLFETPRSSGAGLERAS